MRQALPLPDKNNALTGRDTPIEINPEHLVLEHSMTPPYPENTQVIYFAMGCFWGAEKAFWTLPNVVTTAVGYGAGITPNPTYKEVCSGQTGHAEIVLVVYKGELNTLLKTFWESHDPTQGMRQGGDIGTQYRSGVYCTSESQLSDVQKSKQTYQANLISANKPAEITTEVKLFENFYFAEDYHQQYLAKNPNGYCGLGGTGVCL